MFQSSPFRKTGLTVAAVAVLLVVIMFDASPAAAHDPNHISTPKRFGMGIDVNVKPKVEETGLPLYPGATIDRDHRDDEEGVNLNLWFGSYGLKLVVVKLTSDDRGAAVETFYRKALSAYGETLDCTNYSRENRSKRSSGDSEKKSTILTCNDIQMGKLSLRDGTLYKSGTRSKQYGVAVQSKGDGTKFQLFHFEKRGLDD